MAQAKVTSKTISLLFVVFDLHSLPPNYTHWNYSLSMYVRGRSTSFRPW